MLSNLLAAVNHIINKAIYSLTKEDALFIIKNEVWLLKLMSLNFELASLAIIKRIK